MRGSVLVQGGQGLLDYAAKPSDVATSGMQHSPISHSKHMRSSANSQMQTTRPRYSYRPQNPDKPVEKVGEYVTKQARAARAQNVRASHFRLGYHDKNDNLKTLDNERSLDKVMTQQKWNVGNF